MFQGNLAVIAVSGAVNGFGGGLISTYLPLYFVALGGNPITIGLMTATASVIGGLMPLLGGFTADHYGRRKIMVSVLTCAPCTVLFTLARSFLQALVVAILLIVTGIYYAPAHAALQADLAPRIMRGRITALWQLSSSLATASGALAGGFLFQTVNQASPFYLFTAAEPTAELFLITLVKEPQKKEI